ncbi:1-aminocyclopropane-1-carboxylate oxidase homolog 1-like [Apium graveolens]|uniref:1-aminocyclopropane-1-carboxylate oxidase homolog 1-like n=1 Tax=Apium graveolens TaxID=4045 RepID=UPI003D7945D7
MLPTNAKLQSDDTLLYGLLIVLTKKPKVQIVDIDVADANNELAAVEYMEDMYKFYKLFENETKVFDYIQSHPEINKKMRAILVDWLIEIHKKLDLMPENIYLTINIIDRYLATEIVGRKELQLLGISSMLTTSKYEEIWALKKEMGDYVQSMIKLRPTLSELLSEALGLSSDYLWRIECMKSEFLTWLYYPACPEPDLAFGAPRHSDPTFLTILLQDTIGGLQFLHQDHWVDVPPIPGALIAHIGDLMQIISNDKFKSADHRVLAHSDQIRVSAACFLYPSAKNLLKPYGPIMELMSDSNQPMYKEIVPLEYALYHQSRAMDGTPTLSHYKL